MAERENYVVISKAKEYIASSDMRTSGDLIEGLNEKVTQMLDAAIERCKANGRSTVRTWDL